jgi:hypothetical protein
VYKNKNSASLCRGEMLQRSMEGLGKKKIREEEVKENKAHVEAVFYDNLYKST